jgi:hypothetical protein
MGMTPQSRLRGANGVSDAQSSRGDIMLDPAKYAQAQQTAAKLGEVVQDKGFVLTKCGR